MLRSALIFSFLCLFAFPLFAADTRISDLISKSESGDSYAQSQLARAYRTGQGVPLDTAQALFWAKKSAAQNHPLGLCELGDLSDDTTAAELYKKSFPELKRLAERGDAAAQLNLGGIYDQGWGVKQDFQKAASWYRKAAEQGDPVAQGNLAHMYYEGLGVPQNFSTAAKWYRRSADQGDPDAQVELAGMYLQGEGVPQNDTEAAKWLRASAAQGNTSAQFILRTMYESNGGILSGEAEFARQKLLAPR